MDDRSLSLGMLLPALLLFAGVLNWALITGAVATEHESEASALVRAEHLTPLAEPYEVVGDTLVGSPSPEAETMWARFVELVPREHRATVGRFSLFRGDDKDAYVEQLADDVTQWSLALNEDLASRPRLLDRTLVHELGHLISFHPGQVPPVATDKAWYLASRVCPTYMAREGCANVGSYMDEFVAEFWEGELLDEWEQIAGIGNDELRMSEIEVFATTHNERFVSDYAATNPEEDLAESFVAYVLGGDNPPEGDLRDRIRFFDRFPELVTLRQMVRANR